MAKKIFTAEELYQMVVSCYFTGKCKSCPFWKMDVISPLGRCLGRGTVGTALLDILEPLQEPTLFSILQQKDQDSVASDQDSEAGDQQNEE